MHIVQLPGFTTINYSLNCIFAKLLLVYTDSSLACSDFKKPIVPNIVTTSALYRHVKCTLFRMLSSRISMIQYGDILSRSGEVEADVLRADLVALLTDTLCRICTTPLWLDRGTFWPHVLLYPLRAPSCWSFGRSTVHIPMLQLLLHGTKGLIGMLPPK